MNNDRPQSFAEAINQANDFIEMAHHHFNQDAQLFSVEYLQDTSEKIGEIKIIISLWSTVNNELHSKTSSKE